MAEETYKIGDTITLSNEDTGWKFEGVVIATNDDEGTCMVSVPSIGQVLTLDSDGKVVGV